jgi:hypothetical protein
MQIKRNYVRRWFIRDADFLSWTSYPLAGAWPAGWPSSLLFANILHSCYPATEKLIVCRPSNTKFCDPFGKLGRLNELAMSSHDTQLHRKLRNTFFLDKWTGLACWINILKSDENSAGVYVKFLLEQSQVALFHSLCVRRHWYHGIYLEVAHRGRFFTVWLLKAFSGNLCRYGGLPSYNFWDLVHMNEHVVIHQLFPIFQSAYRPYYSTETAVVSLHDDMVDARDQRHVGALMLLDMSAAFDTAE